MFDGLYTNLTQRFSYKLLALLTPLIALVMISIILTNGLTYGIDFKGGMWIDIMTGKDLTQSDLASLTAELENTGLKDVKPTVGYDVNTDSNKLTIQTVTVVDDKQPLEKVLTKYTGELTESDTATVVLTSMPPADLEDNLEKRLKYGVDLNYTDNMLTIKALDLEKEDLDSSLSYYLGSKVSVELKKKNFNVRSVGPTLGQTFREQGIKALFMSFILMSIVVFVAFRELVPCIAVIQAAVCDIVIALGGMSLFGIPLEPATIGALLMLIGYSVDTDIMLTSRTLKDRRGEFDQQVEDALKTGLTMTGTTLAALSVILVISTTLTQIATWANIASVLLIGLVGDLPATWFTNTGIIKWYVETGRTRKKYGGRKW